MRYGAGEARLTGLFRTDGIVRALGGLFGGQFTTAQRNAISPTTLRPYGLIIFNTDTNRYEQNLGTEATPNWQGLARGVVDADIADGVISPVKFTRWPSAYMKFRAGFGAAPDASFRNATGGATLIDTHNGSSWITTPSTTLFTFPAAGTYRVEIGAEVPNAESGLLGAFLIDNGDGSFDLSARGTVGAGGDPSANIIRSGIASGSRLLTVGAGAAYHFGGYWSGGSSVDFWVTATLHPGF